MLTECTEEDHYKHGYDQCEKDNSYNVSNWDVSILPTIAISKPDTDFATVMQEEVGQPAL
jgi:hypothetical protein